MILGPLQQKVWMARHCGRLRRRPNGRITYAVRGLVFVNYPGKFSGAQVLLEKISGTVSSPDRYTRASMREVGKMDDLGSAPMTAAELRRLLAEVPDGTVVTAVRHLIRLKGRKGINV